MVAGLRLNQIIANYFQSIAVRQRVQELEQLIIVYWFYEVTVEPSLLRPATILFLSPSSQSDHHDVLTPRLFSDVPADIVPVELRQADVQQDDVGAMFFNRFERLEPVVSHMRAIAVDPQQHCE